jgi:excisionase family DNA binding protein
MTRGRLLKPEVAEQLYVSLVTVKKWLREGRLKGVKVAGMWRVYESDLEQMSKKWTSLS